MKKEKIEKRLENISQQLNSPDIQFQAAALDAFIDIISTENLTSSHKEKILPYLEKIINESESSLRTECFKAVCLIGLKDFDMIKDIFPIIFQELEKKNRFRSEIIMDTIFLLKNSNNPLIQDVISKLIRNTPKWFDESYLISIMEKFWSKSTDKGFQFIDKYINEIKEAIVSYPNNLRLLIFKQIEGYNEYLKQIKAQKEKEAQIREEKLKKREELKREKEELERRKMIEQKKMKEKLGEYVKSISSQNEIITKNNVQVPSQVKSNSSPLNKNNESISEIEKNEYIKELNEEEHADFTTFTKLGLKRKDLKK